MLISYYVCHHFNYYVCHHLYTDIIELRKWNPEIDNPISVCLNCFSEFKWFSSDTYYLGWF